MNKNTLKKTEIHFLEYGRNIQSMVEYCKTLSSKTDRQSCAETIISIMKNMHPNKSKTEESENILWHQLALMAEFDLDIDYPVEISTKEKEPFLPQKVKYSDKDILLPHYGHNIQTCINEVAKLEEGEEKTEAALRIAKQMKHLYLNWNKDHINDYKIFMDLFNLSDKNIVLSPKIHSLGSIKKEKEIKKIHQRNKSKKKHN